MEDYRKMRVLSFIAGFLLILFYQFGVTSGQVRTETDALIEATRLLESGDIELAIKVIEHYLEIHPDDVNALHMLAKALYWSGNFDAARSRYEEALVRNPDDTSLRLEYARMLVETNNVQRASALLVPLTDIDDVAAEAKTLLGIKNYWEGDWIRAEKYFTSALHLDPEQAEAERNLNEILKATSPLSLYECKLLCSHCYHLNCCPNGLV